MLLKKYETRKNGNAIIRKEEEKMSSELYYNGEIITMEKEGEQVEAVFVENGRIQKVGSLAEVKPFVKKDTKEIDLKGKTMLPAFIDAHSHISAFAQSLSYISLADCKSIVEILEKLKLGKEERKQEKWIIGVGYDQNFLKEKRHPTRWELDSICEEKPLLITHISGHMGVANTKALEMMQITEDSMAPEGGRYGKENGKLNGYLEETAFIENTKYIEAISQEKFLELLDKAQNIYRSYGIKTVQDGLTTEKEFPLLKQMAEEKKWKVDVISYIDIAHASIIEENKDYLKTYKNHLKIGGYKMILDGSPQGKTAWMTKPYEGEENYRGNPTKTNEEVENAVHKAVEEERQLLAHCNGDAAAEQYIQACQKQPIEKLKKIRPVMIHAQTVRKDQLEEMKKIGMIPSFFIAHVYYWGDIHLKNLGEDRGSFISPAKSAEELGLIYTFHQDSPVLPPNMLETIWCAVNRTTKNGVLLGKEEQISVYEALKAVTIWATYSYFEEEEKGSIREGKKADFVLLDKNPLKVPKEEIRNIKVIEVI